MHDTTSRAAILQQAMAALLAHTDLSDPDRRHLGLRPTDVHIARHLAALTPAAWNAAAETAAAAVVHDHRTQALTAGVKMSTIPPRPAPQTTTTAREALADAVRRSALSAVVRDPTDGIAVVLPAGDPLEQDLQHLPGWRYHRGQHHLPPAAVPMVLDLAGAAGIPVDPAVHAPPPAPATLPGAALRLRPSGEPEVVLPDRDPGLVAELRRIAGRRWDGTARANVFPPRALPALIGFADRHGITVTDELRRRAAQETAREAARPHVTLHPSGEHLVVDVDYDPAVMAALREHHLDQSIRDPHEPGLRLPLNLHPDAVQPLLDRLALRADTAARHAIGRAVAAQQHAAASSAAVTTDPFVITGLHTTLLPYQQAGVQHLLKYRRCIVGDATGNTTQAVAAIHAADAYPAIVICPAARLDRWRRQLAHLVPGAVVSTITGRRMPAQVRGPWFVLATTGTLTPPTRRTGSPAPSMAALLAGIRPGALVVDEAHPGTSPDPRLVAALSTVARAVPDSGLVLDLAAAPPWTRLPQLHAQLVVLGRLDRLGEPDLLLTRYAAAHRGQSRRWVYGTPAHLTELEQRLRALGLYLHRPASAAGVPALRRDAVLVTEDLLDTDHLARYREAERRLLDALAAAAARVHRRARGASAAAEHVRAVLLEQLAEHLPHLDGLRHLAAVAKVPAAGRAGRHPDRAVVLAHTATVVDAIAASSPDAVRLPHGGRAADRADAVTRFSSTPPRAVLVADAASLTAGGDLTAAQRLIEVELGWAPGDSAGAVRALHRVGQRDQVVHQVLIAAGTIDELLHRHWLATSETLPRGWEDGGAARRRAAQTAVFASFVDRVLSGTT